MRLILLLLALIATPVSAMQLDEQGCIEYAIWSRDLVWAREIGADREKTRASLMAMRDEPGASEVFVLLVRDLDRLFATRVDRHSVMQAVARECLARRGGYGSET